MKKENLAKGTKLLLDIMFYVGILVTITLPQSIRGMIKYGIRGVGGRYTEVVVIYSILGVAALIIIWELRKIFKTVLVKDFFVRGNVKSLRRIGNLSFFIVLMSIIRSIVYVTVAMLVVILVFIIAGLFSKVLAWVFDEAITYKEENDLTI